MEISAPISGQAGRVVSGVTGCCEIKQRTGSDNQEVILGSLQGGQLLVT